MARLRIGFLVALTLLYSAPALGDFWDEVYRGLELATTPAGSPLTGAPGGGRSNGSRFGNLRIVPNQFGHGYRLEMDRTFGIDSRGRPEVYDLGNFELELNGPMQATLDFTRRGILTGNFELFANNVSYVLRGKSGFQDIELTGALSTGQQLEVNRFGFYSLNMELNNTNSSLTANGVPVDGDIDTDFDIGPIRIRGNLFYDAALAVLTTLGLDTTELEGVFPTSPIGLINDEIQRALFGESRVLGEALSADLQQGRFSNVGALQARDFISEVIRVVDDSTAYGPVSVGDRVPESSTLLLIGLLALVGLRRRH